MPSSTNTATVRSFWKRPSTSRGWILRSDTYMAPPSPTSVLSISRPIFLVPPARVEPAGRAQQDPGEQAGAGGRGPEHEEGDRVAACAADLQVAEQADVGQRQRVDEREEQHRRHARGEEGGPQDRADALRHRARRMVEAGRRA